MSTVGHILINPGGGGAIIPPTIPDDPPVPTTYLGLITSDGATAAWPMEESNATGVYADVIGSSPATLNRGLTSDFASTPIGPASVHSPHYAGSGSGSTGAADIAAVTVHSSLFDVGTGDFAMEYWGRFETMSGAIATFGLPMALSTDDLSAYVLSGWSGEQAGTDFGKVIMQGGVQLFTPLRYDDNVVRHLVFTRRSGLYVVIIDGIEVVSGTPDPQPNFVTDQRVHLGGLQYAPIANYNAYTMAGRMSWAAWYNNSLSAAQAAAHYAAGLP